MNSTLVSSTLTVDRAGYQLHVKIDGQGTPPLLIVGSATYYNRVIPRQLRKHFQCIFIDHRGFAPSRYIPKASDISLETISLDIEHIRQQLGIQQAIIMGAFRPCLHGTGLCQTVSRICNQNSPVRCVAKFKLGQPSSRGTLLGKQCL